jgi:hypothetical protein
MPLPPDGSKDPITRNAHKKGISKMVTTKTVKNNDFIGRALQCRVTHTNQVLLVFNPTGTLQHDKSPLTLSQQRVDAEFEVILALYLLQQLQ